ncbi:MAG: hypothetical protein B7Z80_04050 [Rhodospirillales bacterium 20-64-7]|nr:MAG: hypothetical protein B7Z80_04050 [Rhodospirillales bacterium 20-64-7]
MTKDCLPTCVSPRCEHSVPYFWPLAGMVEMGEQGLRLFERNLNFLTEAQKISAPPPPRWATENRILLDMDTMRLRDFSGDPPRGIPVLVDAPYAGHSATIARTAPVGPIT